MKRHLFCLNIFCIKKMGARLAVAQATVAIGTKEFYII